MIKISEDICIRGRLNFSNRKRLNQLSLSCCIYFCRKGTLFRSRLFLAWNHNCYRVFWRSSNLTNDHLLTGYGRLEMRHYNGKGSVLFSVRNRLKAEMPLLTKHVPSTYVALKPCRSYLEPVILISKFLFIFCSEKCSENEFFDVSGFVLLWL